MCCFPFLYHMTTTLFAKDQKPKTIVSLFFYLIGPSHMHEQEEKGQRLLHVAGRQRQTEAPESSKSQPAQPPPPLREGKAEPAALPAPLSPACPHPPSCITRTSGSRRRPGSAFPEGGGCRRSSCRPGSCSQTAQSGTRQTPRRPGCRCGTGGPPGTAPRG